jgi:AraC-like DNA-binding protein
MSDLERSSHAPRAAAAFAVRSADPGRMRHLPREELPRHPHDHGFAALVLSGGYVEAGDTGRHRMEAGDVLLHQSWESHLDRFDRRGAEVLVLPIEDRDAAPLIGQIADPDAIVRLAERDRGEAARQLLAAFDPRVPSCADWPDLLAQALRADPALPLTPWARDRGLHLGSLSRGFRQVFGVAPVAYRLIQRTRRAMDAVRRSAEPLSHIAVDSGFADQAHMSRAIRRLANTTPRVLRRLAA